MHVRVAQVLRGVEVTWLWHWILSLLVWLSADPATIESEPARAAAAVAAARAAVLGEVHGDDGVEGVATVPTPKFNKHAQACKQCFNRNPRGPGLCEEGMKLVQEDLRDARKSCTTGTCSVSR